MRIAFLRELLAGVVRVRNGHPFDRRFQPAGPPHVAETLDAGGDRGRGGAEAGRLLDAVVQTHGTAVGAKFLNDMTKITIGVCPAFFM